MNETHSIAAPLEGEVHVWQWTLDLPEQRIEALRHLLSTDEEARARRFVFSSDSRRFIAARGFLRITLGRYVNLSPRHLRFNYSNYGKPFLARDQNPHFLRFNLSHSGEFALIAVTGLRAIGIDLEQWRPRVLEDGIADRFFSSREAAALHALPLENRLEGFFNCWTRKEAFIKAKGEGLSIPLDRFDVSLTPGEPAALLNVNSDRMEASRWSMHAIDVGPRSSAAIAVRGSITKIRYIQWSESGDAGFAEVHLGQR